MILHSVYLQLGPKYDAIELAHVMGGLDALCAKLPGCLGFQHGPNIDLEKKSTVYPYGFVVSFASVQALTDYAQNSEHKALGARLVDLCAAGGDGIVVFDLSVGAT